jgi:hypothetical protein
VHQLYASDGNRMKIKRKYEERRLAEPSDFFFFSFSNLIHLNKYTDIGVYQRIYLPKNSSNIKLCM